MTGTLPACVLDSQTIKTSANERLADQGTDADKRIIARKRHLRWNPAVRRLRSWPSRDCVPYRSRHLISAKL